MDETNNGYVVDPNNPTGTNTPCPAGQAVGVAVGDTSATSTNTHAVDLTLAPVPQGGALMTFFCAGVVSGGSTQYLYPGAVNTSCSSASAGTAMQPVSFSGTIRNLEVFYVTAPGATHTDTFTVYKCPALASCAATTRAITCQISGATTPSHCSDTSDAASVSQGDGIQIVDAAGGSSTAANPRVTVQIQ